MIGKFRRWLDKPIGRPRPEIVNDRSMMLTEVVEHLRTKAWSAQQIDLIDTFIHEMNHEGK